MAHFAEIGINNIVLRVIVVHNNDCLIDGVESEKKGVLFCQSLFGQNTNWKQTSYNGSIRKNYAGIDYVYDVSKDAFIPPKPFSSWVLNENTCLWNPPVPYPDDGKYYQWDEPTTSWVEITGAN